MSRDLIREASRRTRAASAETKLARVRQDYRCLATFIETRAQQRQAGQAALDAAVEGLTRRCETRALVQEIVREL